MIVEGAESFACETWMKPSNVMSVQEPTASRKRSMWGILGRHAVAHANHAFGNEEACCNVAPQFADDSLGGGEAITGP